MDATITQLARDENGQIYSVRYDAVNAMLLNEFLKEHRKVAKQETTIIHPESIIAEQEAMVAGKGKQIEALSAGLQKVSDQLKLSGAAQGMVRGQPAKRISVGPRISEGEPSEKSARICEICGRNVSISSAVTLDAIAPT